MAQVADFGLARSLINRDDVQPEKDASPVLTDYVATRWYRAPEILAGSSKYSEPVDLWSLGCIFGEMLGGKPVFSGTSTLNQFEKIIEVIGFPSPEDIESLDSPFVKTMLDGMSVPTSEAKTQEQQKEAWKQTYPSADEAAIDLLTSLMQFSPAKRITARQGLTHPYCSQFHDEESEIIATNQVTCAVSTHNGSDVVQKQVHDNDKKSTEFYRSTLYELIRDNRK